MSLRKAPIMMIDFDYKVVDYYIYKQESGR